MQVANRELCQELFELSGWKIEDSYNFWWIRDYDHEDEWWTSEDHGDGETVCPAYDLGYLLRKLPYDSRVRVGRRGYSASWSNAATRMSHEILCNECGKADTPEDAACKLAIELWKQGVLTKEADA